MKMDEIPRRVHFVGIGGVGMSGLAQHLHNLGYTVSGSDRIQSDRTYALEKIGIKVHIGHRAENVANAELVVHTSAVHDDNVEVVEANKRKIPVILREQLLGTVFNSFEKRIAVCGTHGKTTVTAMIHEILVKAQVSHTALIGGVYKGNNYFFGENIVVAEACEFNRSFYNLYPTVCVCLNAEYDHPDCYESHDDVLQAFANFMSNTDEKGTVVLPYELRNLCARRKRLCFDKHYEVSNVTCVDGKPSFDITIDGETHSLQLGVAGQHNVSNALAAISVTHQLLNVPLAAIESGLRSFTGVDRRWTEYNSELCKVIIDYAHHPTELMCSVATAQSIAKGNVVCVFQPHTFTRTQAFFDDFATCFDGVSAVAYLPIYSAREKPIVGVNSYLLAERANELGVNAHFLPDFVSAKQWIESTVTKDDVLLILGAGDINELANML